MPNRAISRNIINGRSKILGHVKTEGHGLIEPNQTTSRDSESIVSKPIIGGSINDKKFLKVKPKSYISFD